MEGDPQLRDMLDDLSNFAQNDGEVPSMDTLNLAMVAI